MLLTIVNVPLVPQLTKPSSTASAGVVIGVSSVSTKAITIENLNE
jgi:hypothetical protein